MANVDALERTLAFIKSHPDRHDQAKWICGTTACFAGWAVQLEENWLPGRVGDVHTISIVRGVGETGYVDDEAKRILGLTSGQAALLFNGANSVETLELLVKGIANGDSMRELVEIREKGLTDEQRADGEEIADVEAFIEGHERIDQMEK